MRAERTLVDIFANSCGMLKDVPGAAGEVPDADERSDRVIAPLRVRQAVVLISSTFIHVNTSSGDDIQLEAKFAVAFVAAVGIQTVLMLVAKMGALQALIDVFAIC